MTAIRGTRLIPMHSMAPKRLFRAVEHLPVRGNMRRRAKSSDDVIVIQKVLPYLFFQAVPVLFHSTQILLRPGDGRASPGQASCCSGPPWKRADRLSSPHLPDQDFPSV